MGVRDSRSRILKDIGKYGAANYLAAFMTFTGHIIFRRCLDPEQYGVWEVLLIVLGYITMAELGLTNGMSRELPFYLGRNDHARAESIQNSVSTVVVAITLIMALALLAASFVLEGYPSELLWGLRVLSVIAVLTQVQNIYTTLIKSHKEFSTLSKARVLSPLLVTVFSAVLIYMFGIYGIFAGNLLAVSFVLAYLVWKTGYRLKVRFDMSVLKPVAGVGLMMFVWGYLTGVFLTMDRLLVAKFLGTTGLGLYSIATMVQSAMTNFPRSVSANMYPRIIQAYGQREEAGDVHGYVVKTARMLAYISAFMLAVAYFAVDLPVVYILPKYAAGLGAAKILLAGTCLISLRYTFEHLLVAADRVGRLALLQLPPSVAMVGLTYLLLRSGYGLEGVALAMSAAFLFYMLTLVFYANRIFEAGMVESARLIMSLVLPFCYTLVIIAAIEKGSDIYMPNGYGAYWPIVIKTTLAMMLASPLVYYVNVNTGLLSKLFGKKKHYAAAK